ncbi:MAG: acetyl-CoA carboxylase biotin carboxylase subunit [Chloroflexota bacterium]|nr:acetyl-CoA carboxylase biotin carboxylase subunit [Chloroflexota bacterium]
MTGTAGPDRAASLRKDGGPPFGRVLVANRGEIALRIIRTCRELGMEAIAVYSDADADALHVRAADRAVRIGPAPAADSYLRGDVIVEAALASGAEAIHPGYGFLAERASFARAVEHAGLVFVGPPSETIASLGDKLAARRLARDAGLPIVPGTLEPAAVDGPDQVEAVLAEADGIGFPLLVKAAAGGGGRGMRRVERREGLPAALVAAAAEAASTFGDGTVYLEREVRPARHVEVQLLGDAAGTIVVLGERDCSIQRRRQKLIEEAPAPGLTREERARLHEMALRIGRAARLTNAATAEFLFDTERRFWFLEVNTRLQVEHGVTELLADLDLVAQQFAIAAGRALSPAALNAATRAADPSRHAIEARISAEDPASDFAAAPGRVGRWAMPGGPGVRVDAGVEAGSRVPPDYDPLVAKLLVVAADRPAALARLRRALEEVEVTGIQTTLPLHRFVADHPSFLAADISTDWVAQHWDGPTDRTKALAEAQLVAARIVAAGTPKGPPDAVKGPGRGSAASAAWRAASREAGLDRWPR